MQAMSLEPGALPVDQLAGVCHSSVPAPPVQVSVQLGSAIVLAGTTARARRAEATIAITPAVLRANGTNESPPRAMVQRRGESARSALYPRALRFVNRT